MHMTLEDIKAGAIVRIARQQERIAKGLSAFKTPIEKLADNPKSMRSAITAMCYDCIGRDADPDFRGAIRGCVCHDCPLYKLRPYQTTRQREKAEVTEQNED